MKSTTMIGYETDPTHQLDRHKPESKEVITHRGATIEPGLLAGYDWQHPNYIDGVVGCGHGSTVDDCIEAIDEFLDEIE